MEQMTTYNSPQMMKRHKGDNVLSIVTYKEISNGDSVTFKNENWSDESIVVTEIKEQRPSRGDFGEYKIPTFYLLAYL